MIISASRRTDIPAFYSDWFMRRIMDGFVKVANPFNPRQTRQVDLRPEAVDAIIFWTRNPRPLSKHLKNLQKLGYRYYFLYTITGYPREFEPNLPASDVAVVTFRELSERIGTDKVIWRYDPIILSSLTDSHFHKKNFDYLSGSLEGATDRVIVSFLDFYRKTNRRIKAISKGTSITWQNPGIDDIASCAFVEDLREIANGRGITMQSCAEERDLKPFGIFPGQCVDCHLINAISGLNLPYKKDSTQRPRCLCCTSVDIGAYNTCGYRCVYCYANASFKKSTEYLRLHDNESQSLGDLSVKESA